MKLPIAQLSTHLSKTLAPVYWIQGDELLLVQETTETIRNTAQQQDFLERVFIGVENNSEWEKNFYTHIQDFSLLSNKRIIEIIFSQKPTQKHGAVLKKYFDQPATDIVLLVRSPKLDTKTEQTQWFQALEKNCILIPCWPITLEQLPGWILQRAKKYNVVLSSRVAALLAERVEGNMLAAAQAIEKLALLNTPIDEATLVELFSDDAHFDLFDLVESAVAGQHTRALRILQNLKSEGTEPTLILWALTRELRTLAELFQKKSTGIALPTLFKQFRIFEKRQTGIQHFLRIHSLPHCHHLLTKAATLDRIIKGAESGNCWDGFNSLILAMGKKHS